MIKRTAILKLIESESRDASRFRRRAFVAGFSIACLCGSLVLALGAGPPTERPTGPTPDCTTSGCHSSQIQFKFLHAPTASGACEMCHVPQDASKHTFIYKHEGAAMCDFCHIGKTDAGGQHMHDPVQKGQCLKCHNPHGSDVPGMIKGPTTGAMCLTCHESVTKDKQHIHTPIAQGDCLGCHKPHSSVLPNLLVKQGRDLCLQCHASVLTSSGHGARLALGDTHTTSGNQGTANVLILAAPTSSPATQPTSMFVHPPFQGECTQCHDQHASNYPTLLKQDVTTLCKTCHAAVTEQALSAAVPHAAVTDARSCLNCHSPHQSDHSKLLNDKPVVLCLECHNKEIDKPDGSKVASVAGMAAKDQHMHGAMAQGFCSVCHDVHGGAHAGLLSKPYTQTFYQSFNDEAYALCFSCHKQELATAKTTSTVTSFRNGDVNLHYVHVTAPGDAGRSCRVCHDTHSAKNAKLVRDSTPFGKWNVPINFAATDTGGSCGAGCHRARAYDRANPVRNDGQSAINAAPGLIPARGAQ